MVKQSKSDSDLHFLHSAANYYIAGRYGVFAHLSSVSANLLHHAIEILMKAAQSTMSLKELKGFNHRLPELWAAFRQAFPTTPAQPFTQVINALHKFEELRYSDSIVQDGASIIIGPGPRPSAPLKSAARAKRHYELWLDEIDALVGIILQRCSYNPDFIFAGVFRKETREFLARDNKQPWSQRPQ